MFVYASFSVDLHRLQLKDEAELEQLRVRLDEVVREYVHPAGLSNLEFDSDVRVEVLETAGSPDPL